MPGIAGIISKRPEPYCIDIVKRMVSCMNYEPHFSSGIHADSYMGVYAGWVAIQGSYADCMPIINRHNGNVLVFSGEHYGALLGENACASARGLEEVDLCSKAMIEKVNGFFAGLMIDKQAREIFLFNDRYGMHRIYYVESPEGFYFSSEAKALLSMLPQTRRIDPRGLGEYFSCDCVLENRTLFDGIGLIPGGAHWKFDAGHGLRRNYYFSATDLESLPEVNLEEFYPRLKEVFARIVPDYFRCGSLPCAVSLTGGLDTRMIMAWSPMQSGTVPCYTFGGIYRDCFDVKIARRVAKTCNRSFSLIGLDRDFFTQFPSLMEKNVFISDGLLDITEPGSLL